VTRREASLATALNVACLIGLAARPVAAVEARADEEIAIAVHQAYGTREGFTIEGRVAERHGERESRVSDSWLVNLWRSLRSLRLEEREGTPLLLMFGSRTWELRTDDEGYFALHGETPPQVQPGWNPVRVEVTGGAARTDAPLLIVPDQETLGVISDVDDTVIVSEVQDRSRLLAHTLLENHLQRQPVPGMAELYRALVARNTLPEAAPVIYLTASPRQLLPAIRAFLEQNGFPPGPIVARKITDGAGGDPLFDQERYKVERIEQILAELPAARFVLVGDDGERDPEAYQTIRDRHPERIEAVYIRRVSPDQNRPAYAGQQPPPAEAPDAQRTP
jgi:phosphatidate phosphatase APP1